MATPPKPRDFDDFYRAIGKRFVEVMQGGEVLEFAAKPASSSGKKTKKCTKGYSCGYSCVSKAKNCRSPLTGQGKNYADWLAKQIQAGIALHPNHQADAKAMGLVPPSPAPSKPPKRSKKTTPAPASTTKPAGLKLPQLDTKKLDPIAADYRRLSDKITKLSIDFRTLDRQIKSGMLTSSQRTSLLQKRRQIAQDLLDAYSDMDNVKLAGKAIMEAYRKDLIRTGLPRAQAEQLTKKTSVNLPQANAAVVRDAITEFHQLTNGAVGGRLKIVEYDHTDATPHRAYANSAKGYIHAGKNGIGNLDRDSIRDLRRIIFHEMGHIAEMPWLKQRHNNWIRQRGGDTGTLTQLKKLSPSSNYDPNEVAIKDDFITPYVGKYYGNQAAMKTKTPGWDTSSTEVLSMGIETFSRPDKMLHLYAKDKEHFQLVVDYLESTR